MSEGKTTGLAMENLETLLSGVRQDRFDDWERIVQEFRRMRKALQTIADELEDAVASGDEGAAAGHYAEIAREVLISTSISV